MNIVLQQLRNMSKKQVRNKTKRTNNKENDDEIDIATKLPRKTNSNKLDSKFYTQHCEQLARSLLGKILVRKLSNGTILNGRIVETECYLGTDDKASATYNGRRTKGNEPLYMEAGTTYVYSTYGMYHCFNISSEDSGGAVLLRGVEPLQGLNEMQKFRQTKSRKTELKDHELCNGPSKLCKSFNITKAECNQLNLADNELFWIENNDMMEKDDLKIVPASRIGIDRAGREWASKPFRFYIYGNASVSKRDAKAEEMYGNN